MGSDGAILRQEKEKAENFSTFLENAETFPVLYDRAKKILIEIQRRHPNNIILIVTHDDIGKMIKAVYYGLSWEEGLQTSYFDNTEVLEL